MIRESAAVNGLFSFGEGRAIPARTPAKIKHKTEYEQTDPT